MRDEIVRDEISEAESVKFCETKYNLKPSWNSILSCTQVVSNYCAIAVLTLYAEWASKPTVNRNRAFVSNQRIPSAKKLWKFCSTRVVQWRNCSCVFSFISEFWWITYLMKLRLKIITDAFATPQPVGALPEVLLRRFSVWLGYEIQSRSLTIVGRNSTGPNSRNFRSISVTFL